MNTHILSICKQEKYVEMLLPQSLLLNTFEVKQFLLTAVFMVGTHFTF